METEHSLEYIADGSGDDSSYKPSVDIATNGMNHHGRASEDRCGHCEKRKTIDEEIKQQMKDHINQFPRVEAHYVRKDARRQYLEPNLSIARMYRLYEEWCGERGYQKAKVWLYHKIFNEDFNLGFHIPKKDQCNFCEEYKNASEDKKGDLQNKYDLHHRNKDHVRQQKENDKMEARNRAAVFDLEQVLPCPAGEASSLFYHRKLAVVNLTIFELAFNKGHNFMWHEGIAGHGANEVASCVYNFAK